MPSRRNALLALGVAIALLPSMAFAASGSSADGSLNWTTSVDGAIPTPLSYSPIFTHAGYYGGNDDEVFRDAGGGSTHMYEYGNSYVAFDSNGGYVVAPDGTAMRGNGIFAYNGGGSSGPGAASLSYVFAAPQRFFSSLINVRDPDGIVPNVSFDVYSGATKLLSVDMLPAMTAISGSGYVQDGYSAYLNIASAAGQTFDRIVLTDPIANGNAVDVGLAMVDVLYSANAPTIALADSAGSADVPEPSGIAGVSALALFAGILGRRRRDRADA